MLDNELINLFLPLISAQVAADGYIGVAVKQKDQPTEQGVNTIPTIYFQKISDSRYGWLRRFDTFDSVTSAFTHSESQQYETVFQVSALVRQDPAAPSYTAADLVNEVAAILQSDLTLATLEAAGVGIQRITAITNTYFTDDYDQFEASPSFDFTLTHKQTRNVPGAVVELPISVRIQGV